MGIKLQVDHIVPQSAGGANSEKNLCLACPSCNRVKSDQTHAQDPVSKMIVPLFNPNTQNWFEHFRWKDEGVRIAGMTQCGRATVIALQMNNPYVVRARQFWLRLGEHPPKE